MDYTEKPVRQATADRLNKLFPAPKPGCYSIKVKGRWQKFSCDGKTWTRMLPVKEPTPEHVHFVAYFEPALDNGHTFVKCRVPGKNNWHKNIVPALRRMLKKTLGQKPEWFNVDGIEADTFTSTKGGFLAFDYQDGDFRPYTVPGKVKGG